MPNLQNIYARLETVSQEIHELRSAREHLLLSTTASETTRFAIPDRYTMPERHDIGNTPDLSPFRLKDVAESIPKYDEQRISVFQFSQACECALKLIPANQELHLVQLIMGRLQGHAYTIMQDSNYYSVAPLLGKLKRIFGSNKSLNQYKDELGNIYMKPNESILEYITRIKEIQTAIIDCQVEQKEDLDSREFSNIERDVLDSFVHELPSDLLIRLKIDGYTDLDDSFARAIQLSKTLETESQRRKHAYTPPPTKLPRRDSPQPYTIQQKPRPPFIKNVIPGQPGPNAPGQIVCHYCKAPGHLISECRKRICNNAQKVHFDTQPQVPSSSQSRPSKNEARVPTETRVRRDTARTGHETYKINLVNSESAATEQTDSPKSPESQ